MSDDKKHSFKLKKFIKIWWCEHNMNVWCDWHAILLNVWGSAVFLGNWSSKEFKQIRQIAQIKLLIMFNLANRVEIKSFQVDFIFIEKRSHHRFCLLIFIKKKLKQINLNRKSFHNEENLISRYHRICLLSIKRFVQGEISSIFHAWSLILRWDFESIPNVISAGPLFKWSVWADCAAIASGNEFPS